MVSRAAWAWARAREFSWRELPHRVREQLRRRLDLGRPVPPAPPGGLPRWPVEVLLDARSRAQVERVVQQVRVEGFECMGRWITPARRAGDLAGGPYEGWSFALDLRAGPDPRPLMELHRLQHLQALSLGGIEAFQEAKGDLKRWLDASPFLWGLGWASGLDVACRVVSLLRLSDAWRGAGAPAPRSDEVQQLRDALWAHGIYLERYPSLYSSANNHRVAEACALVLLGRTFEGPRATRWLHLGLAALDETVPTVIEADGGSSEMAVAYLAFSLEWLLLCQVAHPLPAPILRRMERAASFLGALLDGQGELPAIGDSDEGVVLRQAFPERGYGRSVVGAAAVVLGRPERIPEGWVPDLRARLLGIDLPDRHRPAPARRSRSFPQGGLTVLRSARVGVIVDHGPLGWPALAAHGHADALAVWVEADGLPVLVGQGTGRYRGAPALRRWLRGTGAQNTVRVDEMDQSEPHDDPFLWRSRARASLRSVGLGPDGGRVVAVHDGYARIGVEHRREVWLQGTRLEVFDQLLGEGSRRVQLPFHLAAEIELRADGPRRWSLWRGEARIGRLTVQLEGRAIRQRGALQPGPGMLAPRYGTLIPSCALWLDAQVTLPWSHRWVLVFDEQRP